MKTAHQKRNLVILARFSSEADMTFYDTVWRGDSPLFNKAVVLMFPTVKQFGDFLSTVSEDYSFSLLVHIGYTAIGGGRDGKEYARQLSKDTALARIDFQYTTQDGDGEFLGKIAHHTQKLADESFDITSLPLNRMAELRNKPSEKSEPENLKQRIDFAILTALGEGEHEFFAANMDTIHEENQYTSTGTFKRNARFTDYPKSLLLKRQKQMGMVDAALSASEIVHKYNPAYLIMGGVCGGRKGKVEMFDIIIPKKVVDLSFGSLESGKYLHRDQDAKLNQELLSFLESRKTQIRAGMTALIDSTNRQWTTQIINAKIHFDVMACGPWVVKTEGFIEEFSREKNNMIGALEMESYSIARIGEYYNKAVEPLIVKSVMDYTDERKADTLNNLDVKMIAGTISYLCVRALLPLIKEFEGKYKKGVD